MTDAKAMFFADLLLYKLNDQWAVQLPENKGSQNTKGDTLFPTLKAAKEEALLIAGKDVTIRDTDSKPFSPWLGGPENQTAMAYQRRKKHLWGQVRFNGEVVIKKVMLERLVAEGARLQVGEVNKVQDMTRLQDFRADGEQQRAHAERQKKAGKKKEYRIAESDGMSFYVISKTEYDYATYLIDALNDAQNQRSSAVRSLSELYRLWDALGNVPTVEDEDGLVMLDEGLGTTFLPGTPVQDVWDWFEAKNPRFMVGEVMEGVRYQRR